MFHVFGALAEFERDIIRERTNAGLAAARARGRKGGGRAATNASRSSLSMGFHRFSNAIVDDGLPLIPAPHAEPAK